MSRPVRALPERLASRRARSKKQLGLESLEVRSLMAAGPLGINSGLDFADALKTPVAISPAPGRSTVTRDAQGWITSDAEYFVMDYRVNQPWNGPDPLAIAPDISGTYSLTFRGQATVTGAYWTSPTPTVRNQVYNAATNTTTALVDVGQGTNMLVLDFVNTRRTLSSQANTGLTDIHLYKPGTAADGSQLFTNEFIAALDPFQAIRTLDAAQTNAYAWNVASTNNLNTVTWSQRRLPSEALQLDDGKQGVAWEYLIALANQTDTDLWLNVPAPANDDYVRQLATLIRDGSTVNGVYYAGLEPGRKVYLEYSNEVWNPGFASYQYNVVAAEQSVSAGGSVLNSDGVNNRDVWAERRYLLRTAQIGDIFESVLGTDATHERIRPVLGWQPENYRVFESGFGWFQANVSPVSDAFYGAGSAIYIGSSDLSSVDAILNGIRQDLAKYRTLAAGYTALAKSYGLKSVSYEGGPGLVAYAYDPVSSANVLAAYRDPRMATIVTEHYTNWYASGGDLAMFYGSPYGQWGPQWPWSAAETWQRFQPTLSPKYRGLMDVISAAPATPSNGIVVNPSAAVSFAGNVDSRNVTRVYSATGDSSYYLLRAQSAGNFRLTLDQSRFGAGASLVEVSVNGVTIGSPIEFTASGTVDLGVIPIVAGYNALRIRTIRGQNDPVNSNSFTYAFWPSLYTLTPVGNAQTDGLRDGGFETPSAGPAGQYGSYRYNPSGSAWSFLYSSGVSGIGSGFTSANPAPPQGQQVAFIQQRGAITQAVTGLTAGATYVLRFATAYRLNSTPSGFHDFQVLVDGVAVATITNRSGAYAYQELSFVAARSSAAVSFRGINSGGTDSSSFIDDVSINRATGGGGGGATSIDRQLDGGDFESPFVGPIGQYGSYRYNPTGSPWAFESSAGIAVTGSGFTAWNPNTSNGNQVAFLQYSGAISTTLSGIGSGNYRINFLAAQRFGSDQDFELVVDGAVVGVFRPQTTNYERINSVSFTLSGNGPHTIAFRGKNTRGGDNPVLLDDIRITSA